MSYDFAGKIALVNGASRGIGAAIAQVLGECGAHVILTSRKAESVAPVAAAIQDKGGQAETHSCHDSLIGLRSGTPSRLGVGNSNRPPGITQEG